jgi:hypothetical protein
MYHIRQIFLKEFVFVHKDNYRLIRQQLEQLLQHEVSLETSGLPKLTSKFQLFWENLQFQWSGAIAGLTQNSKVFNQPTREEQVSCDFSYWYNFGWQAWVYSRLEDNPEEGRDWLEQVYRRSKSNG